MSDHPEGLGGGVCGGGGVVAGDVGMSPPAGVRFGVIGKTILNSKCYRKTIKALSVPRYGGGN